MIYKTKKLKNYNETVSAIDNTVSKFSGDLDRVYFRSQKKTASQLPLKKWYDKVKKMRYRRDKRGKEVIARPEIILKYGSLLGRDCKKSTILIASWAKKNNIPYRFIIVSRLPTKKMHHIYPELFINNSWIPADATYATQKIGVVAPVTNKKIVYPKNGGFNGD
jgi:hypothetical protein